MYDMIEKEVILGLLPIVLDINRAPHLPYFTAFLNQSNHQRITLDQWESFLQFQSTVKIDLAGYSDDSACECSLSFILDEMCQDLILID